MKKFPVIIPRKIWLVEYSKLLGASPEVADFEDFKTLGFEFPNRSEAGVQFSYGGTYLDQQVLTPEGLATEDTFKTQATGTVTMTANAWSFLVEAMMRGYGKDEVVETAKARLADDTNYDATALTGLNIESSMLVKKYSCLIESRPVQSDGGKKKYYFIPRMASKAEGAETSLNVQGIINPAVQFTMMAIPDDEALANIQKLYDKVTQAGLIYPFYGEVDPV